jgi:hypothetical protein
MERGLRENSPGARENFRRYDWNAEVKTTLRSKIEQYNWGLLQGMLEARR